MVIKFIKAVFLQFSGIVGAGIFVLPYLFYHSDFKLSLLSLLVLMIIISFLNLFYIDIICRTPGDHQLSGYAKIYLGSFFQKITFLNLFLLGFGALFAYIHLGATFLSLLFPGLSLAFALIFYIALLLLFHLGNLRIAKNFSQIIPLIGIVLVTYLFLTALKLPVTKLGISKFNFTLIGTLIFALSGFTVIPEVEETLRGLPRKKMILKIASLLGLFLASLVYIIFIYAVIKLSGSRVSSDSLTGLISTSPLSAKILSVFGLIITLKAGLNFLLIFKESFYRDFKLSSKLSFALSSLVLLLPLIFFNLPVVQVLSLVGSTTVFIVAVIICLIRYQFNLNIYQKIIAFSLPLVFLASLLLSLA
ncbi:MAG: hypothetical protein Q8P53_03785 [Candidatus Shapirobacteria bacterium]|nr:hypothetical protein [Candidatus Shapirobacteria bacterium]